MNRAALQISTSTSAINSATRLLDATGALVPSAPAPAVKVDVRTLPVIAADALPLLPRGIEARLYQDPDSGHGHRIILWWPVHEIAVELSLAAQVADRSTVTRLADTMVASIAKLARSK
jgi:hypothetical protein